MEMLTACHQTSVEVNFEEEAANKPKSVLDYFPQHLKDYILRSSQPLPPPNDREQKVSECPLINLRGNQKQYENHDLQQRDEEFVAESNRCKFLKYLLKALRREEEAVHMREVGTTPDWYMRMWEYQAVF